MSLETNTYVIGEIRYVGYSTTGNLDTIIKPKGSNVSLARSPAPDGGAVNTAGNKRVCSGGGCFFITISCLLTRGGEVGDGTSFPAAPFTDDCCTYLRAISYEKRWRARCLKQCCQRFPVSEVINREKNHCLIYHEPKLLTTEKTRRFLPTPFIHT